MIFYGILGVGIAVGIGIFISMMKKKKQKEADEREATISGANVTNDVSRVFPGGVMEVPPFGKQLTPIQTYVKARHRYRDSAGESSWYELTCDYEGRQLNVEWEREGQTLYVAVGFDDENPSLSDLGMSEAELAGIDDAEAGQFEWDGRTWIYADSDEISFFDQDGDDEERFYGWEFQTETGDRYINIEKWSGDAQFYVYSTFRVDPSKFEIFDGGKNK